MKTAQSPFSKSSISNFLSDSLNVQSKLNFCILFPQLKTYFLKSLIKCSYSFKKRLNLYLNSWPVRWRFKKSNTSVPLLIIMMINRETHGVSAMVGWHLRQFLVGLHIYSLQTALHLSAWDYQTWQTFSLHIFNFRRKRSFHVNTKYTIHNIQKGTLLIKDINVWAIILVLKKIQMQAWVEVLNSNPSICEARQANPWV